MTLDIEFLTKLLKANRLHEGHCPAFSLTAGDLGGMFQSMSEKYCHCWLDSENVAPEGEGFGHYNLGTKELENRAYPNRFSAYQDLTQGMNLSTDKDSLTHWAKFYAIVPITYNPHTRELK